MKPTKTGKIALSTLLATVLLAGAGTAMADDHHPIHHYHHHHHHRPVHVAPHHDDGPDHR